MSQMIDLEKNNEATLNVATRIEEDLLGERHVPADAYWGIHTLRAIENFNISSTTISDVPEFVRGMVFTKKAAAMANKELGAIPSEVGNYIVQACDLILETGKCMDQCPSAQEQGLQSLRWCSC